VNTLRNVTLSLAVLALSAAAIGCGSSACDDYEKEVNDCCGKAPSGTSCSIKVDPNADSDACQTALDNFKCPF